jgi:hypothetical protein
MLGRTVASEPGADWQAASPADAARISHAAYQRRKFFFPVCFLIIGIEFLLISAWYHNLSFGGIFQFFRLESNFRVRDGRFFFPPACSPGKLRDPNGRVAWDNFFRPVPFAQSGWKIAVTIKSRSFFFTVHNSETGIPTEPDCIPG